MITSIPQLKKLVLRGHNAKWGPGGLFVGEYDGEMWATDRYWVARAAHVAPLLGQYNLSADVTGAYEVDKTVRPATGQHHEIPAQPPSMDAFLSGVAKESYQPAVPVRVAGMQALTRADDRLGLVAAYLLADGTYAGVYEEELAWLSDTDAAPLPEGYRYGDVLVSMRRNSHGKIMVRLMAEVFKVIEPGYWDNEAHEHVKAVEEPADAKVLAYMMGFSYGA
jgi:hypothetical protein